MKYDRLTKRIGGLTGIKTHTGSWCTPFDGDEIRAIERLAELEDEIEQGKLKEVKTCENVSEMHPVDGFTCSECGISLEDYVEKEVDEENGDITYSEYILRYCPNCGAKVVEK